MEALHSYLHAASCNTGASVLENRNRAIPCAKWWKRNRPIGASDEQNTENQNIMSRTPVILGNHTQPFYSEFLSWLYPLRLVLCISCTMFLLLKKKRQMASHYPLKELWLSPQTEPLREGGRNLFSMKYISARKVIKECGCRKPSLYICHGNSRYKKHSDGRNINYLFSPIFPACRQQQTVGCSSCSLIDSPVLLPW